MRFRSVVASLRYGLFVHTVLHKLRPLGVTIVPYRVMRESLGGPKPSVPRTASGHLYEVSWANVSDADGVAMVTSSTAKHVSARLNGGRLCLVAKEGGAVRAVVWCDLEVCSWEHESFPLGESEAYLYGAETHPSARGRGLAPYLRYRCYEALASRGRTVCYSVSEYFNHPAIRFKEKLGARTVSVGLFIGLGRFRRTFRRNQRRD